MMQANEHANLTLQDRPVKELRLQGVSNMSAANAYVSAFIGDYNRRVAKSVCSSFDAHRPQRSNETLHLIFTIRQPGRVPQNLTVHYDKVLYLPADTPQGR